MRAVLLLIVFLALGEMVPLDFAQEPRLVSAVGERSRTTPRLRSGSREPEVRITKY